MNSGILVIQTAFIGDVFLMIPLLKEIRNLYPNDKISIVVREGLGSFLLNLKVADEVFEIKKSNPKSYDDILLRLQNQFFKLLLCPHESLRSAFFAKQVKAEIKVGFYKWWNFLFFNQRIIKNYEYPESMRQLQLLEPIWNQSLFEQFKIQNAKMSSDIQSTSVSINKEIAVDYRFMVNKVPNSLFMMIGQDLLGEYSTTRARLLEQLGIPSGKPFVALFPGSVWATKQWTSHGYAELAEKFLNEKYEVVLMGSQNEKTLCEQIIGKNFQIQNLAGRFKLWESFLIMSAAQLVVTNDSGSMHMAAISDIPTVAIFGPTVLSQGFRPWQNNAIIIENNNLDCRPCGKHGHRKCPLKHHKCMREINSSQVFEACLSLIKN